MDKASASLLIGHKFQCSLMRKAGIAGSNPAGGYFVTFSYWDCKLPLRTIVDSRFVHMVKHKATTVIIHKQN